MGHKEEYYSRQCGEIEHGKDIKEIRSVLWALIVSLGGEVSIRHEYIERGNGSYRIESWEDLATDCLVLKALDDNYYEHRQPAYKAVNHSKPKTEALSTDLAEGGLLCIRKDAVTNVTAASYGSRNTGCKINGIATTAPYDNVLRWLGWDEKKL